MDWVPKWWYGVRPWPPQCLQKPRWNISGIMHWTTTLLSAMIKISSVNLNLNLVNNKIHMIFPGTFFERNLNHLPCMLYPDLAKTVIFSGWSTTYPSLQPIVAVCPIAVGGVCPLSHGIGSVSMIPLSNESSHNRCSHNCDVVLHAIPQGQASGSSVHPMKKMLLSFL